MPKTYAVTGVASGIGAALARLLKSNGHTVIGFDRVGTTENVDVFVPLDLNDVASIEQAASAVEGSLDGLCNNAGLPPRDGLEATILQVNFLGLRRFTQVMLPHLSTGASIVNLASRAGAAWRDNLDQNKRLASLTDRAELDAFVVNEGIDATRCYNLSKEAVLLWTMAMTEELIARGRRANSISPGAIATGILGDFTRAFGDKVARNLERAGRPGTPEEVAQVAAFLLSEQSNWLKGVDVPVDGGMGAFNMTDGLGLGAMKLPAA